MGTMAEMEPSKFTTEETNVPEKLNVRAEVPSPGAQEESANAGAGEQRESCKLTARMCHDSFHTVMSASLCYHAVLEPHKLFSVHGQLKPDTPS